MAFQQTSRFCGGITKPLLFAMLLAVAPMLAAPAHAQRGFAPSMQRGPAQMQREPGSQQMPEQRAGPRAQQGGIANTQVSAEFRTALEPHGRWQHSSRFGDVWTPGNRRADWRPYTAGRWAYTDDWGWYWVADRDEADWGWVTYHYGRWFRDPDFGWAWLPGDEWGPGFVSWRHGGEFVGWAPLPPDEIVVDYRDDPDVWLFVRGTDFVTAPSLAAVILPVRESSVFFRDTVVVNQTVMFSGANRFAVNPGIPANVLAAQVGRPITAFSVQPRVLAGTAQIPGALQVRAQDLRNGRFQAQTALRATGNQIRPAGGQAAQLQPLGRNEQGRLGPNPPRAAQQFGQQQGQQPGQQLGRQQQGQQQPSTTGRAPPNAQQQGRQPPPLGQQQQQGRQQPTQQQPAQTQGRGGTAEQRQGQQPQRQGQQPTQQRQQQAQPQQPQRGPQGREGLQPQQRPSTEGRGAVERRSAPQTSQPGPGAQQRSGAQQQRGPQQGTVGRGGGAAERPQVQQRSQPPQMRGGPATEGRGGGGGAAMAPGRGGGGGPAGGPGGHGGGGPGGGPGKH